MIKRKASGAVCPTREPQEVNNEAAKKRVKSAPSNASKRKPAAARKPQPATNQNQQQQQPLQQQQQQDGPVWIYGLINNIEQMLTQFNNKQRMQQVAEQQQQQQPAFQSSTNGGQARGAASSKSKARSSAQSSGYSTPSSLYSSASLSPPFSSCSSSAFSNSSGAYASSSSSNSPVAPGALTQATSGTSARSVSAATCTAAGTQKKAGHETLASKTTNNNNNNNQLHQQLPRSPISRQIKFHEYKGPPQARKPSHKQQQQASATSLTNSAPVASSVCATQTTVVANHQIMSSENSGQLDPDCVLLTQPAGCASTWPQAAGVRQVQLAASPALVKQQATPTVIDCNNSPAQSSSQLLGETQRKQQQQAELGQQSTLQAFAQGPMETAPSNNMQQHNHQTSITSNTIHYKQQRPMVSFSQHRQQVQQQQQQHLLQQQHAVIQVPVSCQLIQQQQQQQQRRLFGPQPISIQIVRGPQQAMSNNQQQHMFVLDQTAFQQIQMQQQPKNVTVVLQKQAHPQAHLHNQQQLVQMPMQFTDANNNTNNNMLVKQQQVETPFEFSGLHEPHQKPPQFESACTSRLLEDRLEGPRQQQPQFDSYQNMAADNPQDQAYPLPPIGSTHAQPFAEESPLDTASDFPSTCDDLEPTISFESDLDGAGLSSGGQPFEDALLFSEFIDLQDIPLNVAESDWLRKFLPPCSTI